jgi:hypothetical protein
MTAQVVGGELDVTDRQLLRSYIKVRYDVNELASHNLELKIGIEFLIRTGMKSRLKSS